MHMNRTLLWYESLPRASCHHVRGMSPSLHISNKTTIPHYTVAVQAHIPPTYTYAHEQTRQFSLYLAARIKYKSGTSQPKMSVCAACTPSPTSPALSPLLEISTEVNDERVSTSKSMGSKAELETKNIRSHPQPWCMYIGSNPLDIALDKRSYNHHLQQQMLPSDWSELLQHSYLLYLLQLSPCYITACSARLPSFLLLSV